MVRFVLTFYFSLLKRKPLLTVVLISPKSKEPVLPVVLSRMMWITSRLLVNENEKKKISVKVTQPQP
jgi:hypothetical protein